MFKNYGKIVRKEIVDHLERNEVDSDVQHGFVQGPSCRTQVLAVIEEWTKLIEERKPFDCLYFDYRKVFDSVPHMRLMRKIDNCGITGQVHRWIKSFLQGRRQRVRVREAVSGWTKVTYGIPQGSVLGPTLFLLFINYLPQVVGSPVALFADDTKMLRKIQSDEDGEKLQQHILLHRVLDIHCQIDSSQCLAQFTSARVGTARSVHVQLGALPHVIR